MVLLGIDVSTFQGAVDWARVKGSGIAFAFAKATEGTTYTDPTFVGNLAGMHAAGLVPGAFHYLIGSVPGADQCDHFLSVVGDPSGLLVALDVESERGIPDPTPQHVRDFAGRFHARYPEHPLVIYSGGWFWVGHLGDPDLHILGPLWESVYLPASDPPVPIGQLWPKVPPAWWDPNWGGWTAATFLQFSDAAAVPGVGGSVDADAFAGDLAALRRLTGNPAMRYFTLIAAEGGWATVAGAGHGFLALDGTIAPIPAGARVPRFARVKLVPALDAVPGDRTDAVLVDWNGRTGMLLLSDVTLEDLQDPTPITQAAYDSVQTALAAQQAVNATQQQQIAAASAKIAAAKAALG